MAQTKRGRGRPQDTRLGEDLAALCLLSRAGAQTSVKALAQRLRITPERAEELLGALISTDDTSSGISGPLVPLCDDEDRGTMCRDSKDTRGILPALRLTTPEAEATADAFDQLGLDEGSGLRAFVERDLFPVGFTRERSRKAAIERGVWPQLELCARSLARAVADLEKPTNVLQPVITFKYQGDNDYGNSSPRFAVPRALRLHEGHWVADAYDIRYNGDHSISKMGVRSFLLFRMENPAFYQVLDKRQKPGIRIESVPVRVEKKDGRYIRLTCTPEAAQRVLGWDGARQYSSNNDDNDIVVEVPYYRGDWLPRHLMALGRDVRWDDAELEELARDIANYDLRNARRISHKKEGTS